MHKKGVIWTLLSFTMLITVIDIHAEPDQTESDDRVLSFLLPSRRYSYYYLTFVKEQILSKMSCNGANKDKCWKCRRYEAVCSRLTQMETGEIRDTETKLTSPYVRLTQVIQQ